MIRLWSDTAIAGVTEWVTLTDVQRAVFVFPAFVAVTDPSSVVICSMLNTTEAVTLIRPVAAITFRIAVPNEHLTEMATVIASTSTSHRLIKQGMIYAGDASGSSWSNTVNAHWIAHSNEHHTVVSSPVLVTDDVALIIPHSVKLWKPTV